MKKICYTVCSLNRIGQVHVLASSIKKHNPDYHFVLCLADEVQQRVDDSLLQGFETIAFSQLQLPEQRELSNKYNIFELSCALKAYFGNHLYKKYEPEILVYFDTDIKAYHSFAPIEEALNANPIVLTPHYCTPFPDDGKFPLERDVLNSGLYNGGFIGMKKSEAAAAFLVWWQQRLQTQGYNNVCEGMMVDQLWLNLVPLYFPETIVYKHAGCNVAYWNLHERTVREKNEGYFVNDEPLIFFHFSGYRIDNPERLSLHQNRSKEEEHPAIEKLLADYYKDLVQHHFERYLSLPPMYGTGAAKKNPSLPKKIMIDLLAKAGYSLQKIRKV